MRILLVLMILFSSCRSDIKPGSTPVQKANSYLIELKDHGVQDYFERLGSIQIGADKYEVLNHFRRIMAAENWRGQSDLLFLGEGDTLAYRLNSNHDFPSAIHSDQLYFPQDSSLMKIDSLGNILCLPTGCVERNENAAGVIYVQFDSIPNVFRGKYLPD